MKECKKSTKPFKPWNFEIYATTTSKDWGFIPVPGKGGKTTNAVMDVKK